MSAERTAQIEASRQVIEKWVETRRIISQERRDWTLGREMLTERIALVEREIESMRKKTAEAEQSIAEADYKREEFIAENESLKANSTNLNETIAALESRTLKLISRLPDPIREQIKPLSQRIPDNSHNTKLSLAERFQNVVGILNEVNKFNGAITVKSEVRTLPDGTSAEVTSLYVGIGQGYYVSGNGTMAGMGYATADAWIWKPANHAAPQIADAIAILSNEQVARFVQLPIEIK